MPKVISTSIEIKAHPSKVWFYLTDFESYPQWNPFITRVEGEVKKGSRVKIRVEPPGGRAMTFKPTILEYESRRKIRWLGHLLFPGLFDGEHRFELTPNANGTTTLTHSESFRGILVPLFKKQLDNNTLKGFKEMNLALRKRVEGLVE
jgi:hypothetical protein